MCVIVYKNAKVKMPSKEILKSCFDANDDGCGYVINDGKTNIMKKGFMTFKDFWNSFSQENTIGKSVIVHFRWASIGETSPAMAHPFVLDSPFVNPLEYSGNAPVFVHNGHVSALVEGKNKESDTYQLARAISGYNSQIMSESTETMLNAINGGKFLIMASNGVVMSTGLWTIEQGIYYSNVNWKWSAFDYKYYGDDVSGDVCPYCLEKLISHDDVVECDSCGSYFIADEITGKLFALDTVCPECNNLDVEFDGGYFFCGICNAKIETADLEISIIKGE